MTDARPPAPDSRAYWRAYTARLLERYSGPDGRRLEAYVWCNWNDLANFAEFEPPAPNRRGDD